MSHAIIRHAEGSQGNQVKLHLRDRPDQILNKLLPSINLFFSGWDFEAQEVDVTLDLRREQEEEKLEELKGGRRKSTKRRRIRTTTNTK